MNDDRSLLLELLPSLLEKTRDHAVIVLDRSGTIAEWHGASERVLGHSPAQAVGQSFELIFTPEDRELAMHLQELEVARRDGRSEDERWHLRRDGSRFWGSGVLEAVRDRDGELVGFCKILRDRTDLRVQLDTLENRVASHARELERRNQFLVTLVHELRNPLGPLLNAAALLERTEDRERRHAFFEVASRQVEVLNRLLGDLYESTRITRHSMEIAPEILSLGDALRVAVSGMQDVADARQLELRLIVPEVEIEIEADPSRLQQMMSNLLGNAVKYTPSGGHISVMGSVEGEQAVIRVQDDGLGVAPEMLAAIFDLFVREEQKDAAAPEGLGVGLAMVKELARLHHGTVEVRSPGKNGGSLFLLRLPLRQPDFAA